MIYLPNIELFLRITELEHKLFLLRLKLAFYDILEPTLKSLIKSNSNNKKTRRIVQK